MLDIFYSSGQFLEIRRKTSKFLSFKVYKMLRNNRFFYPLYHNPQIPSLQHEILRNVQGLHCFCGTNEIEHGLCACKER